jgi:hypothetical protein
MGESGGIAPLILNIGTGWRRVVTFTLRPLYHWASPLFPRTDLFGHTAARQNGWEERKGGHRDAPPCHFLSLVSRNSAHVKEIIHGAMQRKALRSLLLVLLLLLLLLVLLVREKLKKCTILKTVSVRPCGEGASVRKCW